MGAWGVHSWDNDDAADWLAQLDGLNQPVFQIDQMNSAFKDIRTQALAGDIDADTACHVIAAAEVIATDLGQPREVGATDRDMKLSLTVNSDVLSKSRAALALVTSPVSELADLWDDTDEADTWRASVADLDARLVKAAEAHGLPADFKPIEVTLEDDLGDEVQDVYDELHAEFERLADKNKGDPSIEVLRQLGRKINALHTDVTHMRHAVMGRLDDLTDRLELLETRRK